MEVLEARVRQLEEQLRQAQKMEAVGLLTGGIAHDFNNLLTVITGCAQVLLDEIPPESTLRVEAEEIMKASERAATLTSRLLTFSRRQGTQPTNVDLNRLVADMDGMLRRVIGEDIELHPCFGQDLGHVRANPGQLEHLIMNLVVNALDAMPHGGRLSIQTTNVGPEEKIVPGVGPAGAGPFVMLSVADTGVGMDEETKSHLFQPFFTTKAPGKGTGLGLSTVWAIVQQCGGEIWVWSEPGQGTVFRVYLPRVAGQVEVPEKSQETAVARAATETVLLVEDEERVRRLVLGMLRRQGYTVLEAANGQDALDLARQHPAAIDVLLTDVVMPKMNGHEMAARLAAIRPDIRIVYMSGYMDNPSVHKEVATSGAAFLQKPFTQEALITKIRGALEEASKSKKAKAC
jgi:two-component system, cell cycle sensor histidine kinase and response regulator CckA